MRSGLFPSQQRALRQAFKKADKFDHFRQRTRRSFVLGGIAAVGAAAGTFWVGIKMGRKGAVAPTTTSVRAEAETPLRGPLQGKLAVAHRWSTAPDEELRANYALFLVILDAHGGDDLLWAGFARLAGMAEAGAGEPNRFLAQRLLASARRLPPPAFVSHHLSLLQARVEGR
jgi:hypothetical protein